MEEFSGRPHILGQLTFAQMTASMPIDGVVPDLLLPLFVVDDHGFPFVTFGLSMSTISSGSGVVTSRARKTS